MKFNPLGACLLLLGGWAGAAATRVPATPPTTRQMHVTNCALPYQVVMAPNPRQRQSVMAIVPMSASATLSTPLTTRQALSLAVFAGQQYRNLAKWRSLAITVFPSVAAAKSAVAAASRHQGKFPGWPPLEARKTFRGATVCLVWKAAEKRAFYPASQWDWFARLQAFRVQ